MICVLLVLVPIERDVYHGPVMLIQTLSLKDSATGKMQM